MSLNTGFDTDDERFLAHLKISLPDKTDIHSGCQTRWLEERQKRELAERRNCGLEAMLTEERQQAATAIQGLRHGLLRWRSFILGQALVVCLVYGYIEVGWVALVPVGVALPWLLIWRLLCHLRQHPRAY